MITNRCELCGNTGLRLDNNDYCSCEIGKRMKEQESGMSVVDKPEFVPDGYEVNFEGMLLASPYDERLGNFLDSLYKKVLQNKNFDLNYFISMPINTGKSHFMYSIISRLYSYGVCEKPYMINDLDNAIKQNGPEITRIQTAPILFIYLEDVFPVSFAQVLQSILQKRFIAHNKTVILSNTSWNIITKRYPQLARLEGNGIGKTLLVKE